MERVLVTVALFTIGLLMMVVHRIRRDTGARVDTRYFQLAAQASAGRVLFLALCTLAGVDPTQPWFTLGAVATGLVSVHFLVLFAYSFPQNRPAPLALHVGLGVGTVGFTLLARHHGLTHAAGPFLLLLFIVPYFALALGFLQRNWRAAIAPGERTPSAPITLVQACVVAPWAFSLLLFVTLNPTFHHRLPVWVFLSQAVGMALVVVGGTAFAVLRYHLFEVRVLMTEVVLGVAVAGTMATYVGLVAAPFHAWLTSHTSSSFAAVVVAGTPPILMRVLFKALDHMLEGVVTTVHGGAPARSIIEKTLAVTGRMIDPDAVLAMVTASLTEATACEIRFQRIGAIPPGERPDASKPLARLMTDHPRSFYSPAHAPELPEQLVAELEHLDAQLVIPVRREERLYGCFIVSRTARCTRAETQVGVALADHLALKFENFALYAEAAQASRELVKLSREIEESRRLASLGAFAAAIAHDIRTPLTSIQMNVQILRGRAALSESDREYLDIAVTEIERLNRSVGEILEYARPLALRLDPVVPRELAGDVVRALQPVGAEKGVDVRLSETDGASPVAIDERHVRKALINLISNAIEASPRGSVVDVTATSDDTHAVFAVRDAGVGIEPANLERIFEPFFTTRPDGTGLGLAITRKVVRAHDGEVVVESAPGEGTTFTVRLPRG